MLLLFMNTLALTVKCMTSCFYAPIEFGCLKLFAFTYAERLMSKTNTHTHMNAQHLHCMHVCVFVRAGS